MTLLTMRVEQAKKIIKQHIEDIERQNDLSSAPEFYLMEDSLYKVKAAPYYAQLEQPRHRRAFTLARRNALPSAVQEGWYKNIPWAECLCPCGMEQIETIEHVLLWCTYYKDVCEELCT